MGETRPDKSPDQSITALGRSHHARKITQSPSSRKVRCSSLPIRSGADPPTLSSTNEPASPAVGPDWVPVPNKSPGRRLQPLTVWCATSCETVQYEWRKLVADKRCGGIAATLHLRGLDERFEADIDGSRLAVSPIPGTARAGIDLFRTNQRERETARAPAALPPRVKSWWQNSLIETVLKAGTPKPGYPAPTNH